MTHQETNASGSILSQFFWSRGILVGLAIVVVVRLFFQAFDNKKPNAPFVGYRSAFEPRWLLRLRFSKGAMPMVQEGYRKVFLKQCTCDAG